MPPFCIILDLIRDSDPSNDSTHLHSQHSIIFSTLIAFKDDASSLAKLVDAGIVKLLIGIAFFLFGRLRISQSDKKNKLWRK